MNYYIYDNWRVTDMKGPEIHKWNCGHCHMGFGKHKNAKKGENGVWIGPLDTIKFARDYFRLKFSNPLNEFVCIKK